MFSIIAPIDPNRLEQFRITKAVYDSFPQEKEFIMPTRNVEKVQAYFEEHGMMKDVTFIPYEIKKGFNCSKALNLGVKYSKYDQVIVTSPEVKPVTKVLEQFYTLLGENIVAQVVDQREDGSLGDILVSNNYRGDDPSMYFLAMFNKADIEKINGWDEDFMKGYAYEDNDFGARWVRAGLPFKVIEDIKGIHLYHPRSETIKGGTVKNQLKFYDNTDKGITYCKNGLNVVELA